MQARWALSSRRARRRSPCCRVHHVVRPAASRAAITTKRVAPACRATDSTRSTTRSSPPCQVRLSALFFCLVMTNLHVGQSRIWFGLVRLLLTYWPKPCFLKLFSQHSFWALVYNVSVKYKTCKRWKWRHLPFPLRGYLLCGCVQEGEEGSVLWERGGEGEEGAAGSIHCQLHRCHQVRCHVILNKI